MVGVPRLPAAGRGVPDCPVGLVRLSVCLEDVDDLWDDLMRGLNSLL